MREIASKLSRGVILTIDYGFPRTEFYSLQRSEGSVQVRAKQKKLSSPFQQIGLADISAHVEWTGLAEVAPIFRCHTDRLYRPTSFSYRNRFEIFSRGRIRCF